MNLGTLRFLGLRAFQVTAYASMVLTFLGIQGSVMSVFLLVVVGLVYAYVDLKRIVPQEMRFVLENNPYFNEKIDEIKTEIRRLLEEIDAVKQEIRNSNS